MSYSGSVTVIDGLVPANGQDFPLMSAAHIYVNDATRLSDYIDYVNARLNNVEYEPVVINSFTITPAEVEVGSTTTSIHYSYELNKTPATLKIDTSVISDPQATGSNLTLNGLSYTSEHTFILNATDVGPNGTAGADVSAEAKLSFLNKIYWGVAAVPDTYNDAFLLGLANKRLQDSWFKTANREQNFKSFSVNVTSGNYIFFALPASLYSSVGTPIFSVGGFDGGFTQVASFNHTNASGGTATYTVWKSDNSGLGSTTFTVR